MSGQAHLVGERDDAHDLHDTGIVHRRAEGTCQAGRLSKGGLIRATLAQLKVPFRLLKPKHSEQLHCDSMGAEAEVPKDDDADMATTSETMPHIRMTSVCFE